MRNLLITGSILWLVLWLAWIGWQNRDDTSRKVTCSVINQETGILIEKVVWISDPELLEACERGTVITAAEIKRQSEK